MASCSDAVLEFWESRIINALENSSQHSRFREILVKVLTQDKVSISNADESDSGTLVDVVSLHRAHISSDIETLDIVENRFPLGSNVSVTCNLANVIHIYIKRGSCLQHNSFEFFWLGRVLRHSFVFELKLPCVFIAAVVNICDFIFQLNFLLLLLSSLLAFVVNAFVQKLISCVFQLSLNVFFTWPNFYF